MKFKKMLVVLLLWTLLMCKRLNCEVKVKVDVSLKLHKCSEPCTLKSTCTSNINIKIADQNEAVTVPGLHFLVFNYDTGKTRYEVTFNFLSNMYKRQRLKDFLKAIPENSVVMVIVNNKCSADISGWYDFMLQHSKLVLMNLNDLDRDQTTLITTCQGHCRSGILSSTNLPVYHYEDEANNGYLEKRFQMTLGRTDDASNSAQTNDKLAEPDDHKLFVIVLVVSITGVFILFLMAIIMFYCCKKKWQARQREKEEKISNAKRLQWKLENWMRQREIQGINRKIAKVNSNGLDSTLSRYKDTTLDSRHNYKGDIIRCSISTPSVVDFRHEFAYENVFDGDDTTLSMSTKFTTLSRISNADNFSNIATISTSCDTEGYLMPLDMQRYRRESEICSAISESDFSSVSQHGTLTTERYYVREINHQLFPQGYQWFTPSTSRKIFLSTTSSEDFEGGETASTKGDQDESNFAEYFKLQKDGPMYKKPSDVARYKPPEYDPRDAPKILVRADSSEKKMEYDSDDEKNENEEEDHYADPTELDVRALEEGYEMFKEELFKRKLSTPFYEVATKV